jgi:predicted RNA-binding Zn ribbon-like protein
MHQVLDAVAGGTAPSSQSLAAFEKILAAAPPRHRLTQNANKLEWRLEKTEPTLPTLLAPLLWSAADLLIRPDGRLRRCANPKCLWLFHDTSKGGTRRWCFMSSCGNRAKAQRHYHGKKRR